MKLLVKVFLFLMSTAPAYALVIASKVPGAIECIVTCAGRIEHEGEIRQGSGLGIENLDASYCDITLKVWYGVGETPEFHYSSGKNSIITSFECAGSHTVFYMRNVKGNSIISVDPINSHVEIIIHGN